MYPAIPIQYDVPPLRAKLTAAGKFLGFMGLVLAGYAIIGRGFAYLPHKPIFIGEIALMAGLATFLFTRGSMSVFKLPQIQILLLFMGWGLFRTIPYLDEPEIGMLALRDGVVWMYGLFAIIVAGLLIAEPHRLARMFWHYRTFALVFLVVIPIVLMLRSVAPGIMPDVPGTTVSLFTARRGNTMVHMATICVFFIAGFAARRTLFFIAISIPFMMLFGANRAGLLAFTVSVGCATALSRFRSSATRLWSSILIVVVLGGAAGSTFSESISVDKLLAKIESTIGTGEDHRAESSKEWRLEWWSQIYKYTVGGQYRWTGKGFGINLATDDGHQVSKNEELRSPHSIHMNILARMGVPGALLWITLHLTYGGALFVNFIRARGQRDKRWTGVFVVLLAYWCGSSINSSFDVDLEGPMGGIWFWCVIGVGLAAMQIYRTYPRIFDQDPDWHEEDLRKAPMGPGFPVRLVAAAENFHRPTVLDQVRPQITSSLPGGNGSTGPKALK